jgi:hypothetical protein
MSGMITYPVASPASGDLLLGTQVKEDGNLTKNFGIDAIFALMNQIGFDNLNVYADNAAAIAGGLVAPQVYRTSDGTLKVVFNP